MEGLDPRLSYPCRHDWGWIDLGEDYENWLDAAYETIPRLARELDEAREEISRLKEGSTSE